MELRGTKSFSSLPLETLRDGVKIPGMIDVAIHGITYINLDQVTYLENCKTYARTLWIEGVDALGNRLHARIPLFSKTREALELDQERALLSQRLDEIITCVKEIE